MIFNQPKRESILDLLPRLTIFIFGKSRSSWRMLAGLGLIIGQLLLLILLWRQSIVFHHIVVLLITNLVSFWLLVQLSTRWVGYWRLVLLQHVTFSMLMTALVAHWFDLSILTVLDNWSVAMGFGLMFGRIGCLVGGCCYGRFAYYGIRYPWHKTATQPTLGSRRRIPVQGFEAVGLLIIVAYGLRYVLPPSAIGVALITFLMGYGALRFLLEFLRGDKRPYWLFLSEAQWHSVAFIMLGMAIYFYLL